MASKNKLGYFGAGIVCGLVGSCAFSSSDYVASKNGIEYVYLKGKEYVLMGDQMGTIEHRVRGLLNESPGEVRLAIEKVLAEQNRLK